MLEYKQTRRKGGWFGRDGKRDGQMPVDNLVN